MWLLGKKRTIQECHHTLDVGLAALDRGEFRKAIKIGRQLIREPYSGGYELVARALWAKGEHRKALRQLLRGVRVYPSCAPLWEYLGEYYSDFGRYSEAVAAFNHYSKCKGSHLEIFHYNISIVYSRWKKYEQAMWHLSQLEDEPALLPRYSVTEAWCSLYLYTGDLESASGFLERARDLRRKTPQHHDSFIDELESRFQSALDRTNET